MSVFYFAREYLLAPPPPLCASLVKNWVLLPETERLCGYDNSSSNSREIASGGDKLMMMMRNVTAINNALEHHDSRTTHDPSSSSSSSSSASSSPPLAAAYPSVCYNSCFLHFTTLILYIVEI
jgi:hypothetical protein